MKVDVGAAMRLVVVSTLVLSLIPGGRAFAQDTGHVVEEFKRAHIDPKKENDPAALQRLIYDFGACVIRSKRRAAQPFLETFPSSPEAARASQKLAVDDCVDSGEMKFSPEALRGPMYQALYRADFGKAPVTGLRDAPQVDYAANAQVQPGDVRLALRRFADCVVRKDEDGTRKVVMSGVGSSEEASAIQSLGPLMNGCVEKGVELRFTRPLLRALFIETSYRLSVARARQLASSGSVQ
ncbi:MAG: hypothetical protein ACJ8EY_06530 [Sphingomicrobium sp.]